MSLFDLSGKMAIVTGGSRGLGRAMALGLAQAGARVAIVGRGRAELDAAVAEIEDTGAKAMKIVADLLDPAAPDRIVRSVAEAWGGVDILLHAAGHQIRKPVGSLTADDWDAITGIHLKAGFLLAQAIMAHLQGRGTGGKIIFVGSLTSHLGISNLAPYATSKSGLLGLARVLAVEAAENGVCVNTIIPGYYHTVLTDDLFADRAKHDWVMSRIPMKRLGQPEDLAGAAVFFASAASDYVTGSEIRVDGGWLAA